MLCEICGQKQADVRALVEGTMLSLCSSCSSFGSSHSKMSQKPLVAAFRVAAQKPSILLPEEVIVDGFGNLIKSAREKKKLSQEQLAIAVSVKVSLLHKFETEHAEPAIDTAKKIEKYLGISLVEVIPVDSKHISSAKDEQQTIGDRIRIRKR